MKDFDRVPIRLASARRELLVTNQLGHGNELWLAAAVGRKGLVTREYVQAGDRRPGRDRGSRNENQRKGNTTRNAHPSPHWASITAQGSTGQGPDCCRAR